MSIEKTRVTLTTKSVLEKYPSGVSKEDIESGKVKPLEVIEVKDEIEVDEDQAIAMGFDPSQIKKLQKPAVKKKKGKK